MSTWSATASTRQSASWPAPDTRIDLSYEYFHDRRTTDRGVPSDARGGAGTIDNPIEPLDGFDKIFFGDPDDSFAKADVHIATLAIEHQFSEGLTLRNRTLYGDYDKFYQNIFRTARPTAAAQPVTLGAYNSRNDRENLFSQTDLIWENQPRRDRPDLAGRLRGRAAEVAQPAQQRHLRIRRSAVPLSDPTVDRRRDLRQSASDANNKTNATVAAIYIQDQIRISPMFEIVAGLRFDSFKLDSRRSPWCGREFSRPDKLWSPRLA